MPGGDHRRQLARGDRQVVRLDPREQLDVQLLGAVLVGDVEDDQAALLELVGDILLGDAPRPRRSAGTPARSIALKTYVAIGYAAIG